jgi:hypothetical protein
LLNILECQILATPIQKIAMFNLSMTHYTLHPKESVSNVFVMIRQQLPEATRQVTALYNNPKGKSIIKEAYAWAF